MVGIGPGDPQDRTRRAEQVILNSDVVVGYHLYLEHIRDLTQGKEIISSGMRKERERCQQALRLAREGKTVSLVSSGDAGIYGMAGLALEMRHADGVDVPVEIVPGVTAASAAAARLGAPLMLDFACLSLSDLLVPWEEIRKRLEAVARTDLVVCLYNPKSKRRVHQLQEATRIFKSHRPSTTPVGVCSAVGTPDERIVLTDLEHFLGEDIHMRTLVIIGNRSTRNLGRWLVTPRGYSL